MRVVPQSWKPSVWGLAFGLFAAAAARQAVLLPWVVRDMAAAHAGWGPVLELAGLEGLVSLAAAVTLAASALALVAALAGFAPCRLTLFLIRKACIGVNVAAALYAYVVFRGTALFRAGAGNLAARDELDSVALFFLRWDLLWPALAVAACFGLLYLLSWTRRFIALYGGRLGAEPPAGDRILEDLRTHGRDPRYRKSVLSSIAAHLLAIIVVPWLLTFVGCVEDYRVPKGSGTPTVAVAKAVRVVKKKSKKRKYLVNPQSAISFYRPELDDSQVEKSVEEQSRVTYEADPNRALAALAAAGGKMGAGGGKGGGWPDGMDDAKVRFIRLEYRGRGWDDGMDTAARADLNFLDAFHKLTGFKVSDKAESHPVGHLRKYRKGFAPPFVYMTGDQDIQIPEGDTRALREYLLGGGMLFADCGSPHWDRAFRSYVSVLLPGLPLVVISDDDPLFQVPFAFRNGAPPLWHHGGMRAMGVKYKNRWIVFYHPGDINDAWKTGRSGMDPRLAEGATEMGVNIVYYSFTHYLELTRKYRQ